MTRTNRPTIAPLVCLAAASGARTFTGIAAVARTRTSPRIANRIDNEIATATSALALFELMADKTPNIPDRIEPSSLFGRVAAGAIIGAAIANMNGRDRRSAALGGALVAFASAHLSFRFRRSLSRHMPAFVAALVEDAAVLGLAAAGETFLRGPRVLDGPPPNAIEGGRVAPDAQASPLRASQRQPAR